MTKEKFCEELCKLLQETDQHRDLARLEYRRDANGEEWFVIFSLYYITYRDIIHYTKRSGALLAVAEHRSSVRRKTDQCHSGLGDGHHQGCAPGLGIGESHERSNHRRQDH